MTNPDIQTPINIDAPPPAVIAAAVEEAPVTKTKKHAAPKKAAKVAKAAKAPKAKKPAKEKKVRKIAGVKAQGQVAKEAMKLVKALAKEKDVSPAEIVRRAVHKFVGFKEEAA